MQLKKINNPIKSAVVGIESTRLSSRELQVFKKYNPLGFILFARNIKDHKQLKELIQGIKEGLQRDNILFLIDQEGGRVARLRPPHFRATLPFAHFGSLAQQDLNMALKELYTESKAIALDLKELGFNINCSPVADLYHPYAHKVIGERSFGQDVDIVVALCEVVDKAFSECQIQSVIKHIPGHGRANCDSHYSLPVVTTDLAELERSDFRGFKALSTSCKVAMTAHIIFTALDPQHPVTISKKAISYIRESLEFAGVLVSDCLSMEALEGSMGERARQASTAGCDVILYGAGALTNTVEVLENAPVVTEVLRKKLESLAFKF